MAEIPEENLKQEMSCNHHAENSIINFLKN